MGIKINSNIASLGAQRQLAKSSDALFSTYEKLSSGLRINHASDDSASLAIATSINATSRQLGKAYNNINDAISALNIAEGGLQALTDITIRIQELAEQAANGTYSSTQRTALNNQAQALTQEYTRIASGTSFNGRPLLDGQFNNTQIQVGTGGDAQSQLTIGTTSVNNATTYVATGTFQSLSTLSDTGNNVATSVIDINGDGKGDIVTAGTNVNVFLSNGDGTFKAPIVASAGALAAMSFGDINGDGKQDIAVSMYPNNTQRQVEILLGNGDGYFNAPVAYAPVDYDSGKIVLADVNNDSKLDFVVNVFSSNGSTQVALGNGNGTFLAPITYNPNQYQVGLAVADFNNDSKVDILTTDGFAVNSAFLSGNGDGSFNAPTLTNPTGQYINAYAVGDFNGDGKLDVSVESDNGGLRIMIGAGNGTFSLGNYFPIGVPGKDTKTADLNGDGKLDIVATGGANTTTILFGNGDGTFKYSTTLAGGGTSYSVALGDFTGDGVNDIAIGSGSGVKLYSGDAVATQTVASVDLTTQSTARTAVATTSTTLTFLTTQRGLIGAQQSRLQIAAQNVLSTRTNYDAAYSSIMDIDVAEESSKLLQTQILQQAGAAILAQANQQPALVLKLLA